MGSILAPLTPPILEPVLILGLKLGPNAEKVILHAIFLILIMLFNPTRVLTM